MKSHLRPGLILALLLSMLLTACGGSKPAPPPPPAPAPAPASAPAPAAESLKLKELTKVKANVTSFKELTYMLPVQVALEKGFWKDLNLDVEVLSAGGGGDTIRGVASGGTEFAIGGPEAGIKSVIKGENVQIVAPHFNGTLFAWLGKSDTPLKSLQDLIGKKAGYSRAGSTGAFLIKATLLAANIDVSKVQQVSVGGMGENWAAVKAGSIDAGWATEPFVSTKIKEENAKIIFRPSDYLKDLMMDVVVADKDLIKNKPEVVKAFVAGHSKGFDFVRTNPEEAAKIGEKYMNVPADVILAGLKRLQDPNFTLSDKINPAAFKLYEKTMLETKSLAKPITNWNEIVNQSFLPKELQATIPNG